MKPLTPTQITTALRRLPLWMLRSNRIIRWFSFSDFPEAVRFVQRLAPLAEKAWHHPDIDIRWNRVRIALTTHDAGGLTRKDMAMARKLDALISEQSRD